MAAGTQNPPHLGQRRLGVLQMVQDMYAPDEAYASIGNRKVAGVGHSHGGLTPCFRCARRVILDPDRP